MNYEVGAPIASGTPAASADAARNPFAIFIAHGMGQQVPFETIDTMARGICRKSGKVKSLTARTVRVGCETLQRLELEFDDGRSPLHIYEGYWAPLTEGVIGVWEVIRFLVAGAVNGITSGLRLQRFLFGAVRRFTIKFFDILNLVLAVLAVLSIALVGTTVIVVGTARLAFQEAKWIEAILNDLTVIFELLLIVVLAALFLAALLAILRPLRPLITPLAVIAGAAFFVTAVAIVFAFIVNEQPVFPGTTICPIPSWVMWSHRWMDGAHKAMVESWSQRALVFGLAGLGLMLMLKRSFGALVALVLAVLVWRLHDCGTLISLATWLILLGIALFVRWFVVQYAGDVAIYVASHHLDRFFEVRKEIKKAVLEAARSVYAYSDDQGKPVYRWVIMAGHSLGSVVVYDALNRLMNEDDLAGGDVQCCDDAPVKSLEVRGRTRFFLTFGSPLDKTAFIFARHADETGNERETLAAAVQPLILSVRPFPWVNVYSPQDIISGPLDFYDIPVGEREGNAQRVINVRDPFAVTPLKAHVEYWQGDVIYQAILEATAPVPGSEPAPAAA